MSNVNDQRKAHDCNNCSRKGCNGDVIRGKRGEFKRFVACPGQVLPSKIKMSLLENASRHDGYATVLNTILSKVGLRYAERNYYPGFTFEVI